MQTSPFYYLIRLSKFCHSVTVLFLHPPPPTPHTHFPMEACHECCTHSTCTIHVWQSSLGNVLSSDTCIPLNWLHRTWNLFWSSWNMICVLLGWLYLNLCLGSQLLELTKHWWGGGELGELTQCVNPAFHPCLFLFRLTDLVWLS